MTVSRRAFVGIGAATVAAFATDSGGLRDVGASRRRYGERSLFEKSARYFGPSATPATGSSRTPLQDLFGIITPSSLHFERHHAGVPRIDPAQHELLIHGLVDVPMIFTGQDLERMDSVSHIHFIECSGNSGSEHAGRPGATPQLSHGLLSCSEWTGVRLSTLLNQVGIKPSAGWLLAEGADACRHARSIPMDKALADVIVAYGQNGEALRPEQGYPLRLLVPGWEGNVNVKWLRSIQLINEPAMTKDEAATYTDPLPNGKARQFTFVMEAKSVITRPAGGQKLNVPGFYEITGLAWSGRGRVAQVEITVDGGQTWQTAQLQEPVLSKAVTLFRMPWNWNGSEVNIASRCQDETGYWQPTREQLVTARGLVDGPDGFDHYNGIKWWRVHKTGEITGA